MENISGLMLTWFVGAANLSIVMKECCSVFLLLLRMCCGWSMLTALLAAMFITAGAMKLCPFPASLHNGMIAEFGFYATMFPGNFIGYPIKALTYMYVAGVVDFSLGLGLMFGPRKVKVVCTIGVMADMALFLATELSLGMYGKSLVPMATLILSFCLYRHLTDKVKIT